jgi:Fe-S cluster assembly ATP-binding protein
MGEVHAIMGPNGSGKSTLAKAIGGHPDYTITGGDVLIDGEVILELEPDERSRKGLFPRVPVPDGNPGVSIANFLRAALQARLAEGEELDATEYYKRLYEKMDLLKIDRKFTARSVNEGFSGGEKKRNEILQMAMLEPKYRAPGRDRLRPRHRRPQDRLRRRQPAARPGPRHPPHHPLPAPARLHRAGPRARHGRRPHREERRKSLALELEAKGYDWVKQGIRQRAEPENRAVRHHRHRH